MKEYLAISLECSFAARSKCSLSVSGLAAANVWLPQRRGRDLAALTRLNTRALASSASPGASPGTMRSAATGNEAAIASDAPSRRRRWYRRRLADRAEVAREKQDHQDNQHKTHQSAAVVRCAPVVPTSV